MRTGGKNKGFFRGERPEAEQAGGKNPRKRREGKKKTQGEGACEEVIRGGASGSAVGERATQTNERKKKTPLWHHL